MLLVPGEDHKEGEWKNNLGRTVPKLLLEVVCAYLLSSFLPAIASIIIL